MLWILKRTVSAPKAYAKMMGKKIFTLLTEHFCLSKPVVYINFDILNNKYCLKIYKSICYSYIRSYRISTVK